MTNILLKLIRNKCRCSHKNALLNSTSGYCPDCGQYLVKKYYLVRCSRCDIKRTARLVWDEIVPTERYCSNCGSDEYYIEQIDKINFIDAKYALCIKEIANELADLHPDVQVWVDDEKGYVKRIETHIYT